MRHIFNISKLKSRMIDRPKAQRLEDLMNHDGWDQLSEEQVIDLVEVIRRESESAIHTIKINVPYTI